MRELVREGAGIVWIAGSEDPQVLADVPPARAVRRVVDRPGLPAYRRAVGRADARFAVVAWPTPAWAAQVYPELTPEAAVARSATTCCASRGSAPTTRRTAGAVMPRRWPSARRG